MECPGTSSLQIPRDNCTWCLEAQSREGELGGLGEMKRVPFTGINANSGALGRNEVGGFC